MGSPNEPVGNSSHGKGNMGPPEYTLALFNLTHDNKELTLKLMK